MQTAIILLTLNLFPTITATYEYICKEGPLRKPYIKIYDTRQGNLLEGKDYSPGFYDVSHLKNIYVCTNGPVWMFVKHYTKYHAGAEVYDDPIYGVHVHECKFYNGVGGPGSSMKNPDQLKAILLLGDAKDYTSPSLKIFTAPRRETPNDPKSPYQNVTSLVIIDAHQCKILKGPDKTELMIYVPFDSQNFKRICYFPYQNVTSWVDVDAIEIEGTTTDEEKMLQVKKDLANEEGMIEGSCSNRNVLKSRTIPQIQANINALSKGAQDLQTKSLAENDPPPVDLTAEVNLAQTTLAGKKEVADWETEPLKKTEVQQLEKELAELKVKAAYSRKYKQLFFEGEPDKYFKEIIEKAADVDFSTVNTFKQIVEQITGIIAQADADRKSLVEDRTLSEHVKAQRFKKFSKDIEDRKPLRNNAQLALDAALKDILVQENQMEISLHRLQQKAKYLNWYKTQAENSAVVARTFQEPLDMDPKSISVRETETFCEKLPETGSTDYFAEDGACNTKKASKLFGCQLLRASMGEPGICHYQPNQVDVPDTEIQQKPEDDPAQELKASVKELIPLHMLRVLDLIKSIYVTACDRVKPRRFAQRVNNILLCYLIRERQKKSLTVNEIPKKSRMNFWNKIIAALEACASHKHKLIFHKESPTSNKYYLYHKMDLSLGEYFDVPLMKEQAENEFGFNFAIDMNWKVFATVLGLCMPSYESKIPLITSRFFTLYTEEFLRPLAHIWNSTGDNNVFKRILSAYYGVGGTEQWVSTCMEASYIYSSDISYRPPRKLLVNDGSEYNYFVDKDSKYKPNKKTSQQGCAAACKEKKTSDN